jgi:hypothetical protein
MFVMAGLDPGIENGRRAHVRILHGRVEHGHDGSF